MIGDTIATSDLSATTGDLPDATSHVTTLTKVNQDGYGSEYRYRGTDYDYKILIRNSVENPRSDGITFERHNVEFQVIERGDPAQALADVPYISSITIRCPKGGDHSLAMKSAAHLLSRFGQYDGGATLVKILNFES